MELIKYEAACRALDEACRVDEVREIENIAEAMRAYARQAKNKDMEVTAMEVRFRAQRRLGEMVREQRKARHLSSGGRPSTRLDAKTSALNKPPTLAEMGIDKKTAHIIRKLSEFSRDDFESMIGDWRERVRQENERVTSILLRGHQKQSDRAEKEARLAERICALPTKKFGVIYADPPWKFAVRGPLGLDRSAENHYPCEDTDDICALDVPSIAHTDSVLFLWATPPMLPDAMAVMSAWGFTYKSHFVWLKDRTGTGYWIRSQHELLLVGTHGEPPAPERGAQWPSVIGGPVREHSVKPAAFYDLIEEYYPLLPKIELYARASRPGWSCWGYEAPEQDQDERILENDSVE